MGCTSAAALRLLLLLGVSLIAFPVPVVAQRPHVTAAMGYGAGGLFDQEFLGGASHSRGVGRYSASTFWLDGGMVLPSNWEFGLRSHLLRVPIRKGTDVGRLDLVPLALFAGYRHPAAPGRLGGHVSAGIGIASVRFAPATTAGDWESWDDGPVRPSHRSPGIFEVAAGLDYAVSEDFSLELGVVSTFMDTELTYRPNREEGTGDPGEPGVTFTPERAYKVEGRHVLLTLGIRWWVEWW